MPEVHHVGVALLLGVAAVVFAALRCARKLREERRVGASCAERFRAKGLVRRKKRSDLGEVRHRKCRVVLRADRFAARHVRVADNFAKLRAVHARILRQRAAPLRVVPAVCGLGLFGCNQIFRNVGERIRNVYRRHEAGIKADELERLLVCRRRPDAGKCRVHLVERQRVQIIQLVKRRAGDRAAAMVPEQHGCALGRIIRLGKLQKVRQRLRLTHAGRRLLVDEL